MEIGQIRSALAGVKTRVDLEAVYAVVAELAGGTAPAWSVAQEVWRGEEDKEEPELLRATVWADTVGEPPVCQIDKIIPPNSVIGLVGKPKSGKTFMALELAEAVTQGGYALGKWKVMRRGPVCYFSMEDSQYQFRDRLKMRGTLARDPDLYVFKGRKDISTVAGAAWLERKIADISPVLIVLDTARQAFDMDNWNDAAEVTRRIRPLMDLAGGFKNGGSILLVAHSNKNPEAFGGDRISGSNALQSSLDGYMILDKVKRNDEGDLEGEAECQGRIEMPARFAWTMGHVDLRFRIVEDEERERVQRSRVTKDAGVCVAEAIRALGGEATTAEIASQLGKSPKYVSGLVHAAAKTMAIVAAENRQTTGGRSATVWAVNPNVEEPETSSSFPPHTPLGKEEDSAGRNDLADDIGIDV